MTEILKVTIDFFIEMEKIFYTIMCDLPMMICLLRH